MYRKLKRVWSHNNMNYIRGFKETFPELKNVSSEELGDRFAKLGIDFYTEKQVPVNPLIRITLPFAILLILLMLISLPFKFIITGKWGYGLSDKNVIHNWYRSLKLNI